MESKAILISKIGRTISGIGERKTRPFKNSINYFISTRKLRRPTYALAWLIDFDKNLNFNETGILNRKFNALTIKK